MLISVFKMQRSSVQIITLLTVAILVIPAHLQGQTADETETPPSATESAPPKDTNLPGQQIQQMGEADAQMMKSEGMNQMVQTSISNYPLITEITGNSITINRGEDYWVMDGQIIEIWKLEPQMKKIGQARITKVGSATSMAQVLGEPRIEVNDRVRVHPEVTGFESSKITIDRGSNQGLMLGWVVTLWRLGAVNSMQSSAVDSKPQMRKIVGRAVLTEVQPDTSTGRLLGKAMTQPSGGDLIRVERQTTVRQKSGSTVYLDVATDLINILKPGMKVYVFRPYTLMHPDGNHRIVRWEEQIATLKVNHVAEASYTARASIDGIAQRQPLPDDLIRLEDIHMRKRMKAYGDTYVLKTGSNHVYLNRFEEAKKGIQLTIVRKDPTSDKIDSTAPIYNLQVEAVYEHVVVAAFLNHDANKALHVGDKVRYAIYR